MALATRRKPNPMKMTQLVNTCERILRIHPSQLKKLASPDLLSNVRNLMHDFEINCTTRESYESDNFWFYKEEKKNATSTII